MKLKPFLTLLVLMLAAIILYMPSLIAQMPGGPGGDPDSEIPIDGGLGLLVAAGIAYGAKKAYDKRKKDRVE